MTIYLGNCMTINELARFSAAVQEIADISGCFPSALLISLIGEGAITEDDADDIIRDIEGD